MYHLREPWLEPIARLLRFRKIGQVLWQNMQIVDFGCGPEAPLFRSYYRFFSSYIGIDPLARSVSLGTNAKIIGSKIEKTNLPSEKYDAVCLCANLEHVNDPEKVLQEAWRLLRVGGVVIITTPSWQAKPILEFLSFRLHIISEREIAEHKRYFSKEELRDLLRRGHFREVSVRPFEFGCNLFAIAKK